MPLTLVDMAHQGLISVLASAYYEAASATTLLLAVGYPEELIPAWTTPESFWLEVCQRIGHGALQGAPLGGFELLLARAAQDYPGNSSFAPYAGPVQDHEDHAEPPPEGGQHHYLLVHGTDDVMALLTQARALADQHHREPGSIQPAFANREGVFLQLDGWQFEQVVALGDALREQHQDYQISVSGADFPDYMLHQLFVEGPDQQRFEINSVRASTPIRDVARALASSHYTDPASALCDGTVDLRSKDGVTRRLNPDNTLHEENAQDGDTLEMHPESRAGCFLADTPIALSDGTNKPISKIEIGDEVQSWNVETGLFTTFRVTEIYRTLADTYRVINERIAVTETHPFYANQEWILAGTLQVGDVLRGQEGQSVLVESIRRVVGPVEVWNIGFSSRSGRFFAGGVLTDVEGTFFAEEVLCFEKNAMPNSGATRRVYPSSSYKSLAFFAKRESFDDLVGLSIMQSPLRRTSRRPRPAVSLMRSESLLHPEGGSEPPPASTICCTEITSNVLKLSVRLPPLCTVDAQAGAANALYEAVLQTYACGAAVLLTGQPPAQAVVDLPFLLGTMIEECLEIIRQTDADEPRVLSAHYGSDLVITLLAGGVLGAFLFSRLPPLATKDRRDELLAESREFLRLIRETHEANLPAGVEDAIVTRIAYAWVSALDRLGQYGALRPADRSPEPTAVPREGGPLTLQDLIVSGLLNELASAYRRREDAEAALAAVGFPDERIPPFIRPLDFWVEVCRLVEKGVSPGRITALLRQAATDFPHNECLHVFR